ncbi:hypothetical protein DPMN_122087 [Dreissena polymorpha]|uniref:Uncharacterized protein n=1 Tax=Dreissena polymorpha TaxID=45954 RepID=A0A9D4JQ74_DREPO|nr:hypothetical protein DPMN_122087 [Dreissena polymorpha]
MTSQAGNVYVPFTLASIRSALYGSTSVNINVKFATSPIFTDVGPDRDMSGCDVGEG